MNFDYQDVSYDTITDIYVDHELIPGAGFTKRSSIIVNLETRNDVVSETNINDSDLQLLKVIYQLKYLSVYK